MAFDPRDWQWESSSGDWHELSRLSFPYYDARELTIRRKIPLVDGYYAIADLPHTYHRISDGMDEDPKWYVWNPPKADWLPSDVLHDELLWRREYVYLGNGQD
jgi:hypothetical protein